MAKTDERYRKSFPVSWEQLHRDSKALAWRLADLGPWEIVIAITRGGLVPSAIVARELDIRMIDTICVSSYDHQSQSGIEIIKPALIGVKGASAKEASGGRVLLIDDLVDTGRTARVVREMMPDAHFAAVYAKPEGKPMVDSYVTEVSQDTWIFFPWDTELSFVEPIATSRGER